MGKLTIEIEYDKDMKMPIRTMLSNVEYVLEKHFESLPAYTTVKTPAIKLSIEQEATMPNPPKKTLRSIGRPSEMPDNIS